jgi:C4-dicarboxylate-specific signal transduction histidine kinase
VNPAHLVAPPAPPRPHAGRILIAEDDRAAGHVLVLLLQQDGYTTQLAPDGRAAIEAMAANGPPDLLLLDWMLPGHTGLEVCQWARERWDALELPILMVTAKTDPESIDAAFGAGASDYVTKPFRGAEIRARIGAHLRVRRAAEEHRRMEDHLREHDKLSTLGLLAGGVAHDLNNPLAVIGAHAQLLLRRAEDEGSAAQLREILEAVDRCRRIVGDVLGFVRRRPRERGMVEVGTVLRATFALRERHLASGAVRASLDLPDVPLPVFGDAGQLQQVFLNLLLNGEQALRDAGGALRITAATDAEAVTVTFFNDGPPIPPDALPHIWEPFFTTKPADEGTGLGLAISRRIVHEHGGEIAAESGDAGTAFTIRLPAAHDAVSLRG